MKMLISPAWLRQKIESEPDVDIEVGIPMETLDSLDMFLPNEFRTDLAPRNLRDIKIKTAYGMLIRNLRRKRKLTTQQLAEKAKIDEKEVISIEHNPSYQTRPRTVYQLSEYFNIDRNRLAILSGTVKVHDDSFEEEALKFAAKSNGVSTLNKSEQAALNEFVKYLNEE